MEHKQDRIHHVLEPKLIPNALFNRRLSILSFRFPSIILFFSSFLDDFFSRRSDS